MILFTLIFWFDLFLEARADILTKILLFLWSIWRQQKGHFKTKLPLTKTCYYSQNWPLGSVTNRDMLLNETCFCLQLCSNCKKMMKGGVKTSGKSDDVIYDQPLTQKCRTHLHLHTAIKHFIVVNQKNKQTFPSECFCWVKLAQNVNFRETPSPALRDS